MPLENGIDSFANDYGNSIECSDETLTSFFDAREAILQVFRENPSLVREPYLFESVWEQGRGNRLVSPLIPPDDNAIFLKIESEKLKYLGEALVENSAWGELFNTHELLNESEQQHFAEGYALIDMACYLVYLLNVYQPNRALIQNLISTHTKIDALGRENLSEVVKAIGKVVKKSVKSTPTMSEFLHAEEQGEALVVIAKHDVARLNQSRASSPGIDFERNCAVKLAAGGFDVQTTPAIGDYGADLIALKDDLGYAIQCKDTSKPVGVKAVQEAVAARSHYKVDFAVVCASAGFTDAAIELATSNKVLLCNADQLVKRLDSI